MPTRRSVRKRRRFIFITRDWSLEILESFKCYSHSSFLSPNIIATVIYKYGNKHETTTELAETSRIRPSSWKGNRFISRKLFPVLARIELKPKQNIFIRLNSIDPRISMRLLNCVRTSEISESKSLEITISLKSEKSDIYQPSVQRTHKECSWPLQNHPKYCIDTQFSGLEKQTNLFYDRIASKITLIGFKLKDS